MSTTILLFLLASGATNAWLAKRKGYASLTWFWLGALLGVIALFVLLRQPSRIASSDATAL